MAQLKHVLTKSDEQIKIEPECRYRQVTIKLWGKGVILRNEVYGSEITTAKRHVLRYQDFIISRIDSRNGAFGLVPESLDGAIVSPDFPVFKLDLNQIHPKFLEWMSRTTWFIDLCKAASEGTTNRVRLKIDRFLESEIPLPLLDEQRRIVARIEELAARIEEARELRRRAIEDADRIYSSALSFAFKPNDNTWKQETVSDIIISMDAGWSPQCGDRLAGNDEWGVLKTTSVQWSDFRPKENKVLPASLIPEPKLCVEIGDVLVTRAGPRKRVGVVATVRKTVKNLMISDKLIRLRPNYSKIEPRFLELALSSPFSQEYLVRRKTGLADAQVNISQSILKSTPIAYPIIPEQRRIVAYLDDLQPKLDALKCLQTETAAELDALMPSILDRAFRGEL